MKTWKHLIKSRKILHVSFIGLLFFIMFGCASTPSSSAGTTTAGMDLDTAIREAAIQMETRVPSGTMVALVSVASPSTAFSTQVLTRLESAIVSNGKLVVVDRANLDKVRAEQGFQLSGEVDDESAKSIGKLLGAGAIVTGSLTDLGDVYSLTLKAINIETATVAVSYLADLAKTTRIETLLASRDGTGSGGITTASVPARTQPTAQASSSTTATAPIRYTVTFNANGAIGTTPSTQNVQNGESITVPDVGTMTYSRGTFGGWNTRADGTGTQYAVGDSFIVNSNTHLYARWIEQVYKIGDRGPAGGIIFYDKGNYSGGWRYLEAAPEGTEFAAYLNPLPGGGGWFPNSGNWNETDLGKGLANTKAIVAYISSKGGGFGSAAWDCNDLVVNGFDDWYLPSQSELNYMYGNLHRRGLGGFTSGIYWSSTVQGQLSAFTINFTDGAIRTSGMQEVRLRVRACRQF